MSLYSLFELLAAQPRVLRRKKRRRPARFFVETLENRALLTTFTVNTTNPGAGGPGDTTLVTAIGLANDHPNDSGGPDVIDFDIPTSDPGYNSTTGAWNIKVLVLPDITDPVIIDATTQPGYAPGQPLIDIDGSQAANRGQIDGLVFHVGGNTVQGLIINNFQGFGLVLDGSVDFVYGNGPGLNNTIQANFIGTDPTGTAAAPNGSGGIDLFDTSYNLIGGVNAAGPLSKGNLISGNGQTGIFLGDQGDTNNSIEGNYIGTDATGNAPLSGQGATGTDGIFLGPPGGSLQSGFASNNFIGNFDPISKQFEPNGRNVIGGNANNGIYILGGSGNLVAGNYIGLGSDGVTPVANGRDGVRLEDASANVVGGTQANAGNVISANKHNGIEIVADATSENFVSMPVAKQNVVSNVVQGNDIGTDNDAFTTHQNQTPLGNGQNGVVLANFGSDGSVVVSLNLIGGDDASDGTSDSNVMARNIISGNLDNGILLEGSNVTTNTIQGNDIGTNKAGDTALANVHSGILLKSVAGFVGAPSNNFIGEATTGAGNLISGNGIPANNDGVPADGVHLAGGSNGNFLYGNTIGATADGLHALGNVDNGVAIEDAANNFVGGAADGDGNTIGGNNDDGLLIDGGLSTNNSVQRNRIGVGADSVTKLGNVDGVHIESVANNGAPSGNYIGGTQTVGGRQLSLGNTISANLLNGIEIEDGASNNQVIANHIGTDPLGTAMLGNGFNGIAILDSPSNVIGGLVDVGSNFIVNNTGDGVLIKGSSATLNTVLGNYIGLAADSVSPQGNGEDGVDIDDAPGNIIGDKVNGFGFGNRIAGNKQDGVVIEGTHATLNQIIANIIGADDTGTAEVGNAVGVLITNGAAVNTLDTDVVSGNLGNGVEIEGGVGNIVQNSRIGTTLDGTVPLANGTNGIWVSDAPRTLIGGRDFDQTTGAGGKLISGNNSSGILISGANATGTQVEHNRIGTDADAANAVGNGLAGISIVSDLNGGAPSGTIISDNIIAGNLVNGISLDSSAATHVTGNKIGTNDDFISTIPNVGAGIMVTDSPGNFIGQDAEGQDNVISFTASDAVVDPVVGSGNGILITGAASKGNIVQNNMISDNTGEGIVVAAGASANIIGDPSSSDVNTIVRNHNSGINITGAGTKSNIVANNFIGIDGQGAAAKNDGSGVGIDSGASGNIIGGTAENAANIISANTTHGVFIGNGSHDNTVIGNLIGTDLKGAFQMGLGNILDGVDISDAAKNIIGGEVSEQAKSPGNIIMGNGVGVILTGTGSQGNSVVGDVIANSQGFSVSGTSDSGSGVLIQNGASNNQIGGPNDADANSIHDNKGAGVDVVSGTGNAISHNQIFANGGLGILLDPSGGGNNLQAAPTLSLATTGESNRIAGWLEATPSTTYKIEFYSGQVFKSSNGDENNDDARALVRVSVVTTNSSGFVKFDAALPDGTADGTILRATATDSNFNTSEFSNAMDVETDSDGDGVSDQVENGAPHGNSQNAGMVSFPDALNPNGFVSLQAPAGVTIASAWSIPNPSPSDAPTQTQFGLGFISFQLTNLPQPPAPVIVTMTLPITPTAPTGYWRYGPTQDYVIVVAGASTHPDHWYSWNWDGNPNHAGAKIIGNTVELHLMDGAIGDDDLTANGTIVDAGSPGFADPFTVTTTADSGPGSLRQAILNANANPGDDEITFQIPGTAPQTIQPLTPLPAITDPVIIDGFRLPPSEGGGNLESNAPLVELDGSLAGAGADGLTVAAGYAAIQGLIIDRFSGDGIHVLTAGAADIEGNYLGTNLSGASGRGNGLFGIEVENNLQPPDDEEEDQNGSGGPSVIDNGNVVSGNAKGGISLHGIGADGNSIIGNFIGTAADGVSPLGNGGAGVLIDGGASRNDIGFGTSETGNTIAFNAGPGVDILQGNRNSVEGNSIFANSGLGIDLGGDGVTPNDPTDADDGPNELQNFPVVASAASYGGQTFITGTLSSSPGVLLTLDFYASATADPSGDGPGQTFLGSTFVGTDDGGQVSFNVNLPVGAAPGAYITATATLGNYETSEFSAALKLSPDSPLVLIVNTGDDANDTMPDPAHFSLREAILAANSHAGQDIIDFDLPNLNRVILPQSPLPDITDAVIIDGTSRPGYQGLPLVELDGSQAGPGADGLRITGGGSIVRGLVIKGFGGSGIELTGPGGNVIEGNFLGTDVTGTSLAPDQGADVYVNDSPDNLIGGTTAAARNLITLLIVNGYNSITNSVDANAGGNRIEGNYIGADVSGTALLARGRQEAVVIESTSNNVIGGLEPGAGNLIEGGLLIADANDNVVQGNRIGTDVTGTLLLPWNVAGGVEIVGGNQFNEASGNLIGGTTAAARNVIPAGIALEGFAMENTVQGNYIGTDITGTVRWTSRYRSIRPCPSANGSPPRRRLRISRETRPCFHGPFRSSPPIRKRCNLPRPTTW